MPYFSNIEYFCSMITSDFILPLFPNLSLSEKEELTEQIDIIEHKLKFIATEIRPQVCILSSDDQNFRPREVSELFSLLIKIAGGNYTSDITEADFLILTQNNSEWHYDFESLSQNLSSAKAYTNNKLYLAKQSLWDLSSYQDTLSTLETLAEIIQAKYFHYGREGIDWIKLDFTA